MQRPLRGRVVALLVEPCGLLADAGGVQPGDLPVHPTIAGLVVVGAAVRVLPGDHPGAGVQHAVAIMEPDADGHGRPGVTEREVHLEHQPQLLAGHEVAQIHDGDVAAAVAAEQAERLHQDALGRLDAQLRIAGDDVQRLPHRVGDVVLDLPRRLHVERLAAAGHRHALHEVLVEVRAEAERPGRHAPAEQLPGMAHELLAVRDTDVGEPVAHQQHAVHAGAGRAAVEVRRDLAAAAHPALEQVRAAAGIDPAERLAGVATGGGRGRPAGGHDVHAVVIGHHREPVTLLERTDRRVDGPARQVDLGARHGS